MKKNKFVSKNKYRNKFKHKVTETFYGFYFFLY